MDDEVSENSREAYAKKRYEELGFVPQKEIYYNTYLPYADQLDSESQQMLEQIKNNLAKSVASREMKPAIGFYVNKLVG